MLQSVTEPLLGVVLDHRVDSVTECYGASVGCCVGPSSR